MKGLYHLCYTSHSEVICRNTNDYEALICRIAQTAVTTSSQILAYAIMSTHVHLVLLTDSPSVFCKRLRHSYTASFNHKYHRKGMLGERYFFCRDLKNIVHITAAISYVLRNPVHHNVASNPFSYPYSTVNLYFRSTIEKLSTDTILSKQKTKPLDNHSNGLYRRAKHLNNGNITFLDNGSVDPFSFVEVGIVENYFGTYNAFQYNLHRRDFQEWAESQRNADNNEEPVTLNSIEPWIDKKDIVNFEKKSPRWYKEDSASDLELCLEIDQEVQRIGKCTYVQLSKDEKIALCNRLRSKHQDNISQEQFSRCFGGW